MFKINMLAYKKEPTKNFTEKPTQDYQHQQEYNL